MTLGNRTIRTTTSIDPVQQLREADAIVAQFGYGPISVRREGGEFVASAVKTVGANDYHAMAIGRTATGAAQGVVRTITRK